MRKLLEEMNSHELSGCVVSAPLNAIEVRDAHKSYYGSCGAKPIEVLQGLNLSLPTGKIYGLLGPSGCGKTTLLRCIIGRQTLDSGKILVFGHPPGAKESGIPGPKVGFMPQETALYEELKINELLSYYGEIAGMGRKHIQNKSAFMAALLQLPSLNKTIRTLSGGQKRKVSFAITLLCNPPLVILDEPTVGLDPVIRQRLWEYLFEVVSDGEMSVIITTHYIEEARKAHVVGLLFGGRLVAEDVPDRLMSVNKCSTIEKTFLKLCLSCSDDTTTTNNSESEETKPSAQHVQVTPKEASGTTKNSSEHNGNPNHPATQSSCRKATHFVSGILAPPSFSVLRIVFMKNILKFLRHPIFLFFEMVIPTFTLALFCWTVGTPMRNIPFSIVNEDIGDLGQAFLSSLDPAVISQLGEKRFPRKLCLFQFLTSLAGCLVSYLSMAPVKWITVNKLYSNYDSGRKAVVDGHTLGLAHIRQNFSKAIMDRYEDGALASDSTLYNSVIGIALDQTNQQISFTVFLHFMDSFQKFSDTVLSNLTVNPMLTQVPVVKAEPIYGDYSQSSANYIAPAIMVCMAFFTSSCVAAATLNLERKIGAVDRDLTAGVKPCESSLGFIMCQAILKLVQAFIVVSVVILFFDVKCEGSLVLVFLMLILQGLCGTGYGLLVGAALDQELSCLLASIGHGLVIFMFCGMIWPIEGMPYAVRYVSMVHPQTLSVEALRSIMLRGWSLDYSEVYASFLISFTWLGLFLVATLVVYRLKI